MYKILIVDDFKTQRQFISGICADLKLETVEAVNGEEALKILEKEKIGLILTDYEMPILNGMELTKKVRKNVLWKDIPIIMITSVSDLKNKAIASGVSQFVVKPFDRLDLKKNISEYFGEQSQIKTFNVLLLDDVQLQTAIWERVLSMDYFEYTKVHTAQEALNELRKKSYDIILTDYSMPNVDGDRFVRKIKTLPEFSRIPIIMITANKDLAKNKPAEVDRLFIKPFEPSAVKDTIKELVGWQT